MEKTIMSGTIDRLETTTSQKGTSIIKGAIKWPIMHATRGIYYIVRYFYATSEYARASFVGITVGTPVVIEGNWRIERDQNGQTRASFFVNKVEACAYGNFGNTTQQPAPATQNLNYNRQPKDYILTNPYQPPAPKAKEEPGDAWELDL